MLPQRFISDDGACAVELGLEPGASGAMASAEDVAVAGFVVLRKCVEGEGGGENVGGLARNIG